MITGIVNRRYEAVITLSILDANQQQYELETILDTGFTGSLTLPLSIIESLGLAWRSRSSALLANGQVEECDIYAAKVIWDGVERSVLVQGIENDPLLGMGLLVGCDLRARVIVDGVVEIERIP